MSTLDEAVAACKAGGARMPPHLAVWLVARELESAQADQAQLGQALFDLLGGPGPPELASIITRMVHPDAERRWPPDGKALREALYGYVRDCGHPATAPLVREFLSKLQGMPKARDSGEWLNAGPALDAAGQLNVRGRGSQPSDEAFAPPQPKEEVLELARAPRAPVTEWHESDYRRVPDTPQSGRGAVLVVLALLLIGGGVVATLMFFPSVQRRLPFSLAPASRSLLITSEPDGAQVLVDGQVIGTTPFAGDNRWRGRPKVELRKDGYETFRDSFEGGKDQSIAATLRRKR